jgi:hypothetical protein
MFAADAAGMSYRVRDNVHRSAAKACPQRELRLDWSRNKPAEPLHGLGNGLLIGGNDLADGIEQLEPMPYCCDAKLPQGLMRQNTPLTPPLRNTPT